MSAEKTSYYTRFSMAQRIEHFVLIISFTILAITGLIQKFNTYWLSESIMAALGGIESTRIIHRVASAVLVIEAVYHAIVVGYKLYVLRVNPSFLPSLKDVKDALQLFGYNLGIVKHHPKMPRYNFVEKAEYWAMIWGTVIMALTGFILWSPITSAKFFPGEIIPASKAAHGAEAILATAAIFLWHFYNVHFKMFNPSIFTGKMSREMMEEEHGLELEEIERGKTQRSVSAEEIRRRQKIFIPISAVLSVGFLVGLYTFLQGEQTAITTISPQRSTASVYSPQTPTPFPTRTPSPIPLPSPTAPPQSVQTKPAVPPSPAPAAITWDGGIGKVFVDKCGACHGQLGGLSLADYAGIIKGGANGPAIVPKDPKAGTIIQYMEKGGHPAVLTPEELEKVRNWIAAGALEK